MINSSTVENSWNCAHLTWWDKKLSQAEITSIRTDPAWATGKSNLLFYFPMDEGSGTNVNDLSGTPIDATLVNATWGPQPVLLNYSADNPIIMDNDEVVDCYTDDYIMALAAAGAISLKGMITGSSIYPYNLAFNSSAHVDQMAADRATGVGYAQALGWLGIPTPVLGVKGNLTKPGSGQIDDTTAINSAGGNLIVTQANLASAQLPLVVIAGGSLSTVADAYLLDHSIVDKVVVAYIGGTATNMDDYNSWSDGWAAYIVVNKFRMVLFPALKAIMPVVTKSRIDSDFPSSTYKTWIYDKSLPEYNLPDDMDGDGAPAIALMAPDYVLEMKQVSCSGLHNFTPWVGDTHEVPTLAYDENSTTLSVVSVDQQKATDEWWRAMQYAFALRNLLSAISGSSLTSDISAAIARSLAAAILTGSLTPDVAVATARSLLANPQAISATSEIAATLARNFLANLPGGSLTPEIAQTIVRDLLTNVQGLSATADITATISGSIDLVAAISAISTTSDPSAATARAMLAAISGASTTPDIGAAQAHALTGNVPGASATQNIAAAIARDLLAAIGGGSATPDLAPLTILRSLTATVIGGSVTSDITITIAGIISLIAQISGTSTTPEIAASTVRSLLAAPQGQSATADALGSLARSLAANIAGESVAPDIAITLDNLISLSAEIAGASTTTDVSANMARTLSALATGQSITPDIQAGVARILLTDIQGSSITPDDLILILAGLGAILSPKIMSIAPVRSFASIAPVRTITAF